MPEVGREPLTQAGEWRLSGYEAIYNNYRGKGEVDTARNSYNRPLDFQRASGNGGKITVRKGLKNN